MVIDANRLTLGELEDVEDLVGKPVGEIFANMSSVSAKSLKALVFVMLRRDRPDITMEDVEAIELSQVDVSALDPTSAGRD